MDTRMLSSERQVLSCGQGIPATNYGVNSASIVIEVLSYRGELLIPLFVNPALCQHHDHLPLRGPFRSKSRIYIYLYIPYIIFLIARSIFAFISLEGILATGSTGTVLRGSLRANSTITLFHSMRELGKVKMFIADDEHTNEIQLPVRRLVKGIRLNTDEKRLFGVCSPKNIARHAYSIYSHWELTTFLCHDMDHRMFDWSHE